MKIVQVTHSFPPHAIGGREKHVYHLSKELTKLGHEVHVLTSSDSLGEYSKKEEGLNIHYLSSIKLPVSGTYLRFLPKLSSEIKKIKPDIVHAHEYWHLTTYTSSKISKRLGTPFLVTEHGYPKQVGFVRLVMNIYGRILISKIFENSSRLIAVSDAIRREIINSFKVSDDKVLTIHNAVSLSSCSKKSNLFLNEFDLKEKRIVIASGRLIREKGFQFLIDAMPQILEELPNTVSVIIGPDNYYRKHLQKMIEVKGLKGKVILAGTVSEDVLKSAICCSDIVAIPSLYEPFSTSMLEAMAYGKPIVATNVGGMPEALRNGRNALLVRPENSKELAEAIIKLMSDKSLSKKLGSQAIRDVKNFSWKTIARKILAEYKKLI